MYRVNFPPLYVEYAKSVGTRTTHMFLSSKASEAGFTSGSYDKFKSVAIVMQAITVEQFHAWKSLRHGDHNVYLLGHSVGFLAWNVTNRLSKSERKLQLPTTGLIALMAAITECEEVHAIGFGDVPSLGKYYSSVGDKLKQATREKQIEYVIEEFWMRAASLGALLAVPDEFKKFFSHNVQVKMHTNALEPPVCWDDYIDSTVLSGNAAWEVFQTSCVTEPPGAPSPATHAPLTAPVNLGWMSPPTPRPPFTPVPLTAPVVTGITNQPTPAPAKAPKTPKPPRPTDAPTPEPPALTFAMPLPVVAMAEKKPLSAVGNVENKYGECANNASALQLMGVAQCDVSASLCIEHALSLETLCSCYEAWNYCYKGSQCGWTPLIGCANLAFNRLPCVPYNCWTGKRLAKDGTELQEGFVALGLDTGNGVGGLSGESGWTAAAQLQLASFLLVFVGVAVLGVRALRQRGVITDGWRLDTARLRAGWRQLFPNVSVASALSAVRAAAPPARAADRGDPEESKA